MTTTREPQAPPEPPPQGWARLPMIPGPWETVVIVWRRLRKMSTALAMLFTLALSSIVATFIPQEPVTPQTVAAWRAGTEGPSATVAQILDGAHPERVIVKAVERMIPRNVLGRDMMRKLRVYAGPGHPHQSQSPEPLDVAAMNPKNKRA